MVHACRDERAPRLARFFAGAAVAYALSPIDLIPDFIPLLGQLDDLVIVPLAMLLAVKMMPRDLYEEHLARIEEERGEPLAHSRVGAAMVVAVWIVVISAVISAVVFWIQPTAGTAIDRSN